MEQQGVVPNAITYSALISACENGKLPEQAVKAFEAMEQQGVMPNAITYNAFTSACEQVTQLEQAVKSSR